MQNLIAMRLQRSIKCEVIMYSNCIDALNDLKALDPDLVILDYYTNHDEDGMNGLGFMRAMKASGNVVSTIVCSGQRNMNTVVDMLREGALDYISKVDPGFLDSLVTSANTSLALQHLDVQRSAASDLLRTAVFVAAELKRLPLCRRFLLWYSPFGSSVFSQYGNPSHIEIAVPK